MKESDLMRLIQIEATKLGHRLFRNNTGMGYVGEPVRQPNGDILLKKPRPLHAGLLIGSSDLIGYVPRVITQSDVGSQLAIFTSCEVKIKSGKLSNAQQTWLKNVQEAGGIGLVVRSTQEYLDNF